MHTHICGLIGLVAYLLASPEALAFMGVEGMESEVHTSAPRHAPDAGTQEARRTR